MGRLGAQFNELVPANVSLAVSSVSQSEMSPVLVESTNAPPVTHSLGSVDRVLRLPREPTQNGKPRSSKSLLSTSRKSSRHAARPAILPER